MTLEEKLRSMHFRVYGSATDEVWNRDGYCSEDGHYWPCDTVLLLNPTDSDSTVAQLAKLVREEVAILPDGGGSWILTIRENDSIHGAKYRGQPDQSVYVYLTDADEPPQIQAARSQSVHSRVNLDFDADGNLLGVEVL